MQILVTGASGMIGSALVPRLTAASHGVLRLTRSGSTLAADQIHWDPLSGVPPSLSNHSIDAVIHLAGENVGTGRWNDAKKARIRDSRVNGARLLRESLAKLRARPRVLIGASAVGYYGNRGDEVLREESPPGSGFLAEVCRDAEAELLQIAGIGIRAVILRFGLVLSRNSGALAQMLRPFRLGLGGPLGSGEQYMSWIALDDAVGAIEHCLATEKLQGPVNAVAPQPVQNREFAKTLGKVLGRPSFLPAPALALRLALGEMAAELILASQRAEPARLESTHYAFLFPELESSLRSLFRQTR